MFTLVKIWELVRPHLFYWIVGFVVLLATWHWLNEHDAKLDAQRAAQVAVLQQQTKDFQTEIDSLKKGNDERDAQATATIAALQKIAAKVTTPQQAIAALPDVSALPLHSRPSIDNPSQVSVDAVALFQELSACKQNAVALATCEANRTSDEKIIKDKTGQLVNADAEIAIYKKPTSFWKRVKTTGKTLAIGVAVGYALHEVAK